MGFCGADRRGMARSPGCSFLPPSTHPGISAAPSLLGSGKDRRGCRHAERGVDTDTRADAAESRHRTIGCRWSRKECRTADCGVDTAEWSVDGAERAVDPAGHSVDMTVHSVDTAEHGIDMAERGINTAEHGEDKVIKVCRHCRTVCTGRV